MRFEECNAARFRPGQEQGHYESWFLRANHPRRPLAFWIRYTVFSPAGAPADAIGELWAVYFDGESATRVTAKSELPVGRCTFNSHGLGVEIGDARLDPGRLEGAAGDGAQRVGWTLRYSGGQPPLLLLPARLYGAGLPRAKSLVGVPMAVFSGQLVAGGRTVDVEGWVGSQNHNWGSRHTDQYAWGQVCGFDGSPDSFLEVATGRIRLGPAWSPWMTPLVLRHGGEEFALNSLAQAVFRSRARYGLFDWEFSAARRGLRIEGRIQAPPSAFTGLRYHNPPGGEKHCLNSKLASCRLRLLREGGPEQVLETQHRAAFEILTDRRDHGIPIVA